MSSISQDPGLPPSLEQVEELDPALHRRLATDFGRLARAGMALAWAHDRLPKLITAGTPARVLSVLVDEAKALTGAPSVWALTWSGDLPGNRASFRAFAGAGASDLPPPNEISNTVVARVAEEGAPIWTDDAGADARFTAAESVQAFALRSVGCVPIGRHGVLYLQDPKQPGRFSAEQRYKVAALCRAGAPFVETRPAPPRRRRVSEGLPGMVGASPLMADLYDSVRAFAPMPWPALILGESGSGKELVARALHNLSARADKPFVPVNCGAIPETLAESTLFGHERGAFTGADRLRQGLVERARGGTLFLDEVAELPAQLQVKLLRLLQEGTFERVGGDRSMRFTGRILAATNRDVDDPEQRGNFREDLYHRLAACVITVPPLRDHPGDIPDLAQHLLDRALGELPGRTTLTLTEAALGELCARPWPGNVREVENVLRAAIAHAMSQRATAIEPEHLAPRRSGADANLPPPSDGDLQSATEHFQQQMVRAAIAACGGNRSQAAKRLGVSRQWLHRLLSRWEQT
jgi:DNA-binding NtrC family response regulator